ncbi:ICE2-domain-containing protein [Exophiala viscosa]|uniref:ICE2-domain-containing protein n=1 Tax=Exophiala viscosa TaxID=2486360 RepID=A0AAN6DY97_9EURO|nr:ICE2-domain-containing protein [Exophiala viscosa]KAI1624246.1 ICE2-domain-containing protein [Exophiala viscosa]
MFLRALSSLLFLTLIILLVPLTFDIGGRDAGLAFSLSIASFYFILSILRVSTPDSSSVRKACINILRGVQWLVLPSLCIWALGRFSVDANNSGGWVERTFRNKKGFLGSHTGFWDSVFGREGLLENTTLGSWDILLRWSSPMFQLLEGFCSLLVIQAVGQLTKWLVNRSEWSDAWLLTLLVTSAGVVSSSVYFLWRVLQFPDVSNLDSTLIGIAIASAIFLCGYGIVSGRGTAMESSLLFAYIVLCIYQIFTDYKPNVPVEANTPSSAPDFPPFPPIIMSSYTAIMYALSSLPEALVNALDFTIAAFRAVTPSVLISLGYRLFVFYASTRIIPAINESGARGLSIEPSLDDSNAGNQFLAFLSWFSPSILIAVYTSLLMQHFATTMGGYTPGLTESISAWWSGNGQPGMNGNIWKWINLVITMGLYAVELWLGKEDDIDGGHWKVD